MEIIQFSIELKYLEDFQMIQSRINSFFQEDSWKPVHGKSPIHIWFLSKNIEITKKTLSLIFINYHLNMIHSISKPLGINNIALFLMGEHLNEFIILLPECLLNI
jgi:hypothetical protein